MIKIDVEGHEESVINGALDTIRRNYPVLLIESEDRHNPGAPRRLAQMMSVLGYGAYYIKDRQLRDFNTLRNEDTDPKNLLSNKQPYINNFIFIPMTRSALASTIVQRLSNEEPGRTGAFKFRR